MTTGDQLDLISTVSGVSALTHLLNPSGEGGGLTTQWFPYTDINVAITQEDLEVNFEEQELNVAITQEDLEVNFEEQELVVTFDDDTNDIILTC